MGPGAIALNLIPYLPHSAASDLARSTKYKYCYFINQNLRYWRIFVSLHGTKEQISFVFFTWSWSRHQLWQLLMAQQNLNLT